MNAFLLTCNKVPVSLLVLAAATLCADAEPFVPRDDAMVLEHVPSRRDPVARELRELYARLSVNRTNLGLALDLARRYVALNRADGDPRYLGRAESVLAPWWDDPQPPVDALVLRATVKQSRHDFDAALRDLDLAVHLAPADAQAWLTRATVLTVRGEYAQARLCCLALARTAPELVVMTASASIASLTGQGERSCMAIRQMLERNSSAGLSEKLWALTVCAEIRARLGRAAEAEVLFRQALALGRRDIYLLGAFVDFLLDHQRPEQAAALLQNETRVDGLLLRLALAEAAQENASRGCAEHVRDLKERFAEAHLRGDFVHQREEARFTLHLLHQPARALELAKANWAVQREPADVRILLEAALAAKCPGAAEPAVRFVRKSGLEDVRVLELCRKLAASEAK
jgi:tetratricopeptide (TPR) repeat protein